MRVEIDGVAAEIAGDTIAEILQQVRGRLSERSEVLMKAELDGQSMTAVDLDGRGGEPVADIKSLSFTSEKASSLAERTLVELDRHLPVLAQTTESISLAFAEGRTTEGFSLLGSTLELWQVIAKALTEIPTFLGISPDEITVESGSASSAIVRIADFLNELKESVEANDIVTLADVLADDAPGLLETIQELIDVILARVREGA